jgi:hypothetical protein
MEFVPHEMTNPVDGEVRMAYTEADHLRLAQAGWIHQN